MGVEREASRMCAKIRRVPNLRTVEGEVKVGQGPSIHETPVRSGSRKRDGGWSIAHRLPSTSTMFIFRGRRKKEKEKQGEEIVFKMPCLI